MRRELPRTQTDMRVVVQSTDGGRVSPEEVDWRHHAFQPLYLYCSAGSAREIAAALVEAADACDSARNISGTRQNTS